MSNLMIPPSAPAPKEGDFLAPRIFGDRPAHIHIQPTDGKRWWCNSPYCYDSGLIGMHPDNGGLEPVVPGREPWRR